MYAYESHYIASANIQSTKNGGFSPLHHQTETHHGAASSIHHPSIYPSIHLSIHPSILSMDWHTTAFNLTHWSTSSSLSLFLSLPFPSLHFHIKQTGPGPGREGEKEGGMEGWMHGGERGASINAASGVWKKISPPSFINLQDIKAEQPRGGRDEHAHARTCMQTPRARRKKQST